MELHGLALGLRLLLLECSGSLLAELLLLSERVYLFVQSLNLIDVARNVGLLESLLLVCMDQLLLELVCEEHVRLVLLLEHLHFDLELLVAVLLPLNLFLEGLLVECLFKEIALKAVHRFL